MKRIFWVGIGVTISIVCLPILVNFIVGSKSPFNVIINGEINDWIAFYGNYTGSIITSLISFIILYATIKSTQREAMINRKKQDIDNLSKHLEEIISIVNFSRLANISLFYKNKFMCENEILNLDSLGDEIIRKNDMVHLFYERETKNNLHIKEYIEMFDICANEMNKQIKIMVSLIRELNKEELDFARQPHIENISAQINQLKNYTENYTKPLYKASQSWLEIEKRLLDNL